MSSLPALLEEPLTACLPDAPRQSSSSSSKQRALLVLGPGVASAWLDEWLRPDPEAWGGGGRTGMPEDGEAGANTGDQLLGASTSARSMRVPWLLEWWFPGRASKRGQEK